MIKVCPVCKKEFDGNSKRKYCHPKCKKKYENSLRGSSRKPPSSPPAPPGKAPSVKVDRPQSLNPLAAAYWDRVAPTVIERGHLNILSVDAFAELCDLRSRLDDINSMINNGTVQKCSGCGSEIAIPGNRSLLQVDDKWDNREGVETRAFKESALSDLKRKYSKLFLDYCRQFYLTPLSNRGDFGLDNGNGDKSEKEKGTGRFFGD